jgi:glutamyl-tRNA reductase
VLHRVPVRLTSLSFACPDVTARDRAGVLETRTAGHRVFVLATCLRVELAWTGGPDLAPAMLEQLYGQQALPAAKMRTDFDAFQHLARVAAGLESAQVGEAEVLAQFRQAMEKLTGREARSRQLTSVMESALGVARTARRVLSDNPSGSLAMAAARMVRDYGRVVVVGGGAMARAVAAELTRSGEVTVYARRSDPVSGFSPRPWAALSSELTTCPAVVSTIPGPIPELELLQRTAGSRLLLIDLGMPPAIEIPNPSILEYRGVDDVASSLALTPEPDAEEVLMREAEKAWGRLTVSRDASSIIMSVVDLAERTVDEEVSRFAGRFSASDDPEQVLRQLAHTVARRIIHPSISFLGSTPLTSRDLGVLARALGVDRE